MRTLAAALVVILGTAGAAGAGPPEPSGKHPRLWLDAETTAAIKALAKDKNSAVARAVRRCARVAGNAAAEKRNLYMGLDWAANASNCALAYVATGDKAHARTAIVYFTALLDDWENVGDGKGGNEVARHNSGYAIRAYGVHAAIVYDWLHDAPGMTEELRARARERFAAWTSWYYGAGYRFKDAGTNYQAGYLFAVTLIGIAQGGEAGGAGSRLWSHVVEQVWGRDMRKARGEVLRGGDWGEGWQYGAMSVVSYALAARAMIDHGVELPEWRSWADSLIVRHVYALAPDDAGIFVGGDTQHDSPNIAPNVFTLAAVAAGPSSDEAAAWALHELQRLGLATDDKTFLVYEALAQARGVKPAPFPRDRRPTFYLAEGTGAFYVRTTWSRDAVWMVAQCTSTMEVDHAHPNAGNFVLSRNGDELIVDPTPYGTLSSLTGNAPTVESAQLPEDYKPSQAFWSEKTGYVWARQTTSGIAVARCDYADQYKFQHRPSDVPLAVRDLVLLPFGDDATVIVVDRARSGAADRALHLRFRTEAPLDTDKLGAARGRVGSSAVAIRTLHRSGGTPQTRALAKGDCFSAGVTRGNCDRPRFPVHEHKLVIPGPTQEAVHAIDVIGSKAATPGAELRPGDGHRLVWLDRGERRFAVVLADPGKKQLRYKAPAAATHHVVLDAPASAAGHTKVVAAKAGADCELTLTPGAAGDPVGRPLVIAIDDACAVTDDPTQTSPWSSGTAGAVAPEQPATATADPAVAPEPSQPQPPAHPQPPTQPKPAKGCACATAPSPSTLAVLALAFALVLGRRRRARR